MTYANGTSAQYGYTARGDLTCHDWNLAGAAPSACNVAGAEIAYDFTYNGVGQLVAKALNDPLLKWSPPGNSSDAYAANGLNQYTQITPTGGAAAAIVHDGNGNITTDHRGRTYVYDAENVLRAANENGGAALGAYAYYADGARKSKTTGGATSTFYYTGDQEIAEYAGATLTRRYVRLPGSVDEPLLMIDYTLDAACTNASAANCERWAHQNRLGSVIAVSDAAGAVVERYTYSAYGESGNEGDAGFPFRFTGQKLDAETGLYYYKARYYDPETGRFLQTDPIGYKDQMNLYAYVANDPVNNFDPEGRVQRDSSGRIKFDPEDDPNAPGYVQGSDRSLQPVQYGTIYADDGTPIEAFRNNSSDRGLDCNCHGFTFGDGEFWIDPGQVDALLEGDGYERADTPQVGDVAIYRDSDGNPVHSAIVTGVDSETGEVTVEGVDGRDDVPQSSSAGGQGYGDDPEYYRR